MEFKSLPSHCFNLYKVLKLKCIGVFLYLIYFFYLFVLCSNLRYSATFIKVFLTDE